MPLSEHEQRLLDEMERNLYHNDAKFVASVGGRRGRPAYRSVVLGILVAVVGVVCLIVGVFLQSVIVGIIGFVVMLGGVLLAIAPPKRAAQGSVEQDEPVRSGSSAAPRPARFMDRLNERWDKRQNGDHDS